MADQNITELPVKTSSGMTASDYMLGIDSAEGYQMLIKDLGDYIIRNVQVNTIAGANQTLKSALDTLNSKVTTITIPANSDLNDYISPGIYGQNSTSIAATITNTPVNTAFLLEVLLLQPSISGNWLGALQRLTDLTGHYIYVRRMYTNGSGQWSFGSWYNFTGTQVS